MLLSLKQSLTKLCRQMFRRLILQDPEHIFVVQKIYISGSCSGGLYFRILNIYFLFGWNIVQDPEHIFVVQVVYTLVS